MNKKRLILVFCLSLWPLSVGAVELGDNSLQIDSSRIEKEEEMKLGSQDQLIQSLFLAPDQAELAAHRQAEQDTFQTQQAHLFQPGEKPSTDILQVGTLFDEKTHKVMTTRVESASASSGQGLVSGFLVTCLVVGIFLMAAVASYLVSKDEKER